MEGALIILVMAVAVLGPAAIITILIGSVTKSLKRNPAAATKVSIGMAVLMIGVISVSVLCILILFQLFK